MPEGTVVKGRPVGDDLVELVECDHTGFLPLTAKGFTALQPIPGDRVEEGAWW